MPRRSDTCGMREQRKERVGSTPACGAALRKAVSPMGSSSPRVPMRKSTWDRKGEKSVPLHAQSLWGAVWEEQELGTSVAVDPQGAAAEAASFLCSSQGPIRCFLKGRSKRTPLWLPAQVSAPYPSMRVIIFFLIKAMHMYHDQLKQENKGNFHARDFLYVI